MPIEWVTMAEIASDLKMDSRTFKANYVDKWPPDRESGNRKWWKRSTVNKIKEVEFGIIVVSDTEAEPS